MQIYVRNRGYNRSQKFKGSTPHRALPPTFKPKLFDQEEASSTSEISTRDLCLWTANTALLLSRVFFVLCFFLTFIVYSLYQGNRFVSYDGFSKRYVKYLLHRTRIKLLACHTPFIYDMNLAFECSVVVLLLLKCYF